MNKIDYMVGLGCVKNLRIQDGELAEAVYVEEKTL